MSGPWFPTNWRDLPIYPYDPNLPRTIFQLNSDGNPYNPIWCAENVALQYFDRATWALDPMWVPDWQIPWPPEDGPQPIWPEENPYYPADVVAEDQEPEQAAPQQDEEA